VCGVCLATNTQSSGPLQKLPFLTAFFLILGLRSYWTGSFTWHIFGYLLIYYYYFGIVSTGAGAYWVSHPLLVYLVSF
jgi:hypothetical protein